MLVVYSNFDGDYTPNSDTVVHEFNSKKKAQEEVLKNSLMRFNRRVNLLEIPYIAEYSYNLRPYLTGEVPYNKPEEEDLLVESQIEQSIIENHITVLNKNIPLIHFFQDDTSILISDDMDYRDISLRVVNNKIILEDTGSDFNPYHKNIWILIEV